MSVYFIQAGEGGRIKVGFSPDAKRRIKYISRLCGPDLITLAVIGGTAGVEHGLHRYLKKSHAHDEWFEPTPEVLAVVDRARLISQHLGEHGDFYGTEFSKEDLRALISEGGGLGDAAAYCLSEPYHYTWAALAMLLYLVPNANGEVYDYAPQANQS